MPAGEESVKLLKSAKNIEYSYSLRHSYLLSKQYVIELCAHGDDRRWQNKWKKCTKIFGNSKQSLLSIYAHSYYFLYKTQLAERY